MSGYWCFNLHRIQSSMKKIIIFFLLVILIAACTDNSKKYNPLESLNASQQDSIIFEFAVYTDEHTSDSINAGNRFEEKNKYFFRRDRVRIGFGKNPLKGIRALHFVSDKNIAL